jgi:hypothetical protein
MCPDLHLAFPPSHVEIRMMALGFRHSPHLVRKRQRLSKILKCIEPFEVALLA